MVRPRRRGVLWLALVACLCAPIDAAAQVRNVTAAWDPNTDSLTAGYHVLVGRSSGQPEVVLDVARATSLNLPLPLGAKYYVSVRAYAADGTVGLATGEAVVDLQSPPAPPAGLAADVVAPSVTLRWSAGTGGLPSSYVLSVGTLPGSADLLAGWPLGNVNAVSGALPPGVFFVRMHAANPLGSSAPSDLAIVVPGAPRPLSPLNLRAAWNGSIVTLLWTPPSGNPSLIPTSYLVEAGTAAGAWNVGTLNVGGATAFSVDVPPGTFYVRIRGINALGLSDPSNEIIVQR